MCNYKEIYKVFEITTLFLSWARVAQCSEAFCNTNGIDPGAKAYQASHSSGVGNLVPNLFGSTEQNFQMSRKIHFVYTVVDIVNSAKHR